MMSQLYLLCLNLGFVVTEMGPYELEIQSMEKCACQKKIFYEVENSMEIYKGEGQMKLAWNLTTSRTDGPLKVDIELEMLRNGLFVPVYHADLRPCTHNMLKKFLTVIGIKVDNKCKLVKGAYYLTNVNPDFVAHTLTRVLEYGTFRATWQWRVPGGCLTCTLVTGRSKPRLGNSTYV